MEQSLTHISFQDKKDSLDQLQASAAGHIGKYDTRLLPHISLPQRRQLADGQQQIGQQGGLLHYHIPESPNSNNDPGLTIAMDKYELARSIAAAQQVQSSPQNTPPIAPASPIPPGAPDTASTLPYMQAWQPAQSVNTPPFSPSIASKQAHTLTLISLLAFIKSLLTVKLPGCFKKLFLVE